MKTRLTLEEIEQAIRQLLPEELKTFWQWFAEYDAALWDAELEADMLQVGSSGLSQKLLTN
ncbi:MAG: hypothetical protein NZ556_03225 [Fimbriimonadales bacterium]|nr:hypothetical protein [Fimbriimonadales bacterium]